MSAAVRFMLCEAVRRRVCSDYLEMPGLRLTLAQAQRLWGLDERECAEALEFLVRVRFLRCSDLGTYVRMSEGRLDERALASLCASATRGDEREP